MPQATPTMGLSGDEARAKLRTVGPNEAIQLWQTVRSDSAVRQLRDSVAPTVTVCRDGTWVEIRRAEVVPGDLIRLQAGDLIPADARLLSGHDLHVLQASLTGESRPVEASYLIHGGLPRVDRSRTRYSQVTHYSFEGCLYYFPLESYGAHRHLMKPNPVH